MQSSVQTSVQTVIWNFITEFKGLTGDSVEYLRLQKDRDYFDRVIEKAMASGSEALQDKANKLSVVLNQHSSSSKSATFSDTVVDLELPNLSVPEDVSPSAKMTSQEVNFNQYRQILERALVDGQISGADRNNLDQFRHTHNLDWRQTDRIEREIRRDKSLLQRSWSFEFREAVKDLLKEQGKTHFDPTGLLSTYVQDLRLSEDFAQQILIEVVGPRKQGLGSLSTALIGASAAALMTLIMLSMLTWFSFGGSSELEANSENSGETDTIRVSKSILDNTVWRSANTYILEDIIFVEAGARLTIEPGTRVLGRNGSALIVTRDATIYARGQKDAPIVFTSAKPEGQRRRGDWGGLVLLGNGPINRGQAQIEGVDKNDPRGVFGGNDAGSNCGLLEYTRIEFAGFEVFANNELNGLTLGGCSSNTIVRNVQVHKALDDGIEIFGGDVDMKNIVITGARDDSLDWDMGWRGRVQFLVIQQHADAGDNAFEADNWKQKPNAKPRSAPTIYNATLLGNPNAEKPQRGMTLRRGTAGSFNNFLMAGFRKEAIDVRDVTTASLAGVGELSLNNSLLFDIGKGGRNWFSKELDIKDDDGGFSEQDYFTSPVLRNRFGSNPLFMGRPYDSERPDFRVAGDSPASKFAIDPPEFGGPGGGEFWSAGANYIGAIRPGVTRTWLDGWTAYPVN